MHSPNATRNVIFRAKAMVLVERISRIHTPATVQRCASKTIYYLHQKPRGRPSASRQWKGAVLRQSLQNLLSHPIHLPIVEELFTLADTDSFFNLIIPSPPGWTACERVEGFYNYEQGGAYVVFANKRIGGYVNARRKLFATLTHN